MGAAADGDGLGGLEELPSKVPITKPAATRTTAKRPPVKKKATGKSAAKEPAPRKRKAT